MNTTPTVLSPEYQERLRVRRHIIKSIKAKADRQRSQSEKLADVMTRVFGSTPFLILNLLFFFIWVVINLNLFPNIAPFDPFPFNFLTMVVSLEAIILAIFVLISQNRAARVDDLREEIDLQVNLIAEEEVTKIMKMLTLLMEKNGIDISKDKELQKMLRPINTSELEERLKRQIS